VDGRDHSRDLAVQDKVALSAEKEKAIEIKREIITGQVPTEWKLSLPLFWQVSDSSQMPGSLASKRIF